jgi:hypothetical protein
MPRSKGDLGSNLRMGLARCSLGRPFTEKYNYRAIPLDSIVRHVDNYAPKDAQIFLIESQLVLFCFRSLFVIIFPMLTRSQILSALRAAARQLGHAPTRAEFLRLTGIHYGRLIPHFPGGYRSAIRAAGLSPDPGGLRIGTADLPADWARLARKKGRVPTRDEYEREGRYASASLETRFHRWTQVPSAFLKFAESMGLSEQWSDVVGMIHNGPMPKRGGGRRWLKDFRKKARQKENSRKSNSSVPAVAPAPALSPPPAGVSVLPPPLHGMKVRYGLHAGDTLLHVLSSHACAAQRLS